MATYSNILAWEIPMDRGSWWAKIHVVAESDMTEQLSTHTHVCAHAHVHTHTHTHPILQMKEPRYGEVE